MRQLIITSVSSIDTAIFLIPVGTLQYALAYLVTNKVDMILLDLTLPDANGLEALQKIREADNKIPIVVLSGSEDATTIESAMKMGAQDFVVKSGGIDPINLIRSIRYSVIRQEVSDSFSKMQESMKTTEKVMEKVSKIEKKIEDKLEEIKSSSGEVK